MASMEVGISGCAVQWGRMAAHVPRRDAILARRSSLGLMASVVVLASPDWSGGCGLRTDDDRSSSG